MVHELESKSCEYSKMSRHRHIKAKVGDLVLESRNFGAWGDGLLELWFGFHNFGIQTYKESALHDLMHQERNHNGGWGSLVCAVGFEHGD